MSRGKGRSRGMGGGGGCVERGDRGRGRARCWDVRVAGRALAGSRLSIKPCSGEEGENASPAPFCLLPHCSLGLGEGSSLLQRHDGFH